MAHRQEDEKAPGTRQEGGAGGVFADLDWITDHRS
jgi:hypothetical protein